MFAALIIVFREVIEAGLIIGIALAATRGLTNRRRLVSSGVGLGLLGACVVAFFASAISNTLQGAGQEIFNASILLIAVFMLAWHNIWMAQHGRQLAAQLKSMGQQVMSGQKAPRALAVVIAAAVLREGSEVVLFLYGIAASGGSTLGSMLTGGALGLLLGMVVSALTYFSLVRIPSRYLFSVTGVLLCFLAAGMAAQAAAYLQQAGVINVMTQPLWDTSFIVDDGSLAGKTLHALVGYTAQPNGLQAIFYGATCASIALAMRWVGRKSR